MTIKALLFDKDGTLFDFTTTWAGWTNRLLHDLAADDVNRLEDMACAIGFDLVFDRYQEDSVAIAGTAEQIVDCLLPFLPEFSHEGLQRYLAAAAVQVVPQEAVQLRPYLDDLNAQGYRLGVMTNDSESSAKRQLQQVGVLDRFDMVIGADSGFGAKPSPDPLLAFCAHTGVTASETAMIGDSLHDLVSGRSAGMSTIAVLTGIASRDTLTPQADVVLSDIGQIPDWLSKRRHSYAYDQ